MNRTQLNELALNAKAPKFLSGKIAATATVAGAIVLSWALAGSVTATATVTAQLENIPPQKNFSGLNTFAINDSGAINARQDLNLLGSAFGTSLAAGNLKADRVLLGAAAGQSQVTGELANSVTLAGASAGQATASAQQLNFTYAFQGAASGTATVTGILSALFTDTTVFSAATLTEAAKLSGARPVFLFRLDWNTGERFLSDQALTLTDWTEGRSVDAWVLDWGRLDDVANFNLSDTPILAGDFWAKIWVQDGIAGSGTFWTDLANGTNVPEQTDVRLYLWFRDLTEATDPPVRIWQGTIRSWRWTDEQTLTVEFADAIELHDQPVGRPATATAFPNLDSDDVGKIEPIIYGSVKKVPLLAIDAGPNSTVGLDMTDSQNFLYYSDVDAAFAASGDVWIEGEKITYGAKITEAVGGATFGKLLGLTRGADSTTASKHDRGQAIVQAQAVYKYLWAGHAAKAITNLYIDDERGRPVLFRASDYTVNLNDESFSDGIPRTTISITVLPKLVRQVALIADDTIAVVDTIGVVDVLTIDQSAGSHTSINDVTCGDLVLQGLPATWQLIDPSKNLLTHNFSFPPLPSGVFQKQIVTISVRRIQVGTKSVSGTNKFWFERFRVGNSPWSGITSAADYSVSLQDTSGSTIVQVSAAPGSTAPSTLSQTLDVEIISISRMVEVQRSPSTSFNLVPGLIKKTPADKTGEASKSGTVAVIGNSAADTVIGGRLYADGDGYADDAAGTFTGTPNALITLSRDVIKHFVTTFMDFKASEFQTSPSLAAKMSSTYTVQGVVRDPFRARDIASRMAFESGCWLKFDASGPLLIFRERVVTGSVTLTDSDVGFILQTKQTADIQKVPLGWILNKIELRYNRDWRQPRSVEAYRSMEIQEDTASQGRYGIRTQPFLFQFDWVTTTAHAQAIVTTYLGIHKTRRDLIRLRTFLKNPDLAFGDRITVNNRMVSSQVGELVSVDLHPGSAAAGRIPERFLTMLSLDSS